MTDTETRSTPVSSTETDVPRVEKLERATARRKAEKSPAARFVDFLASFGFTCIILLCLMVLTYFGTYAQKKIGLVRAQQEYFDSFICTIDLEPFLEPYGITFISAIRWPGAFLLLSLLMFNLILGGLVRIKWGWRNAGIIVTHFGMILLMIAGLVKFTQSTNGYLQLWPGESGSEYVSFHDWEIAIGERRGDGSVREHLIPDAHLRKKALFTSEKLPFDLKIERYYNNSMPRQSQAAIASNVVDGVYLEDRPLEQMAAANRPGAYVEVRVDGEPPRRGILWGEERYPWTVVVDGVPWTINLRKRVFDMPFSVRLEKFEMEEHPGVTTPRHFSSDVVKIESGAEQKFRIWMNNPMRYGGFMLSQNNWGPQNDPDGPHYTVLEVSSNPSDQWPKWSCYVIAVGMLWHFIRKLRSHVRAQRRRAA